MNLLMENMDFSDRNNITMTHKNAHDALDITMRIKRRESVSCQVYFSSLLSFVFTCQKDAIAYHYLEQERFFRSKFQYLVHQTIFIQDELINRKHGFF